MNTTTDLANYALAFIGEGRITDIADQNSAQARACNRFLQSTIDEVLRTHRWNCATARQTLSEVTPAPIGNYRHAFALPADFIRLLEVNGETWEWGNEYVAIESSKLLSNWPEVVITFIKRIGVPYFDPLLTEAVATKLAMKVAVQLTANLQLQQQLAAMHDRVIRKAAQVDAIEVGSRENGAMNRLLERSSLIRSRYGYGSRYLRDPLRYQTPF